LSIVLPKREEFLLDSLDRPRPDWSIDATWRKAVDSKWRHLILLVRAIYTSLQDGSLSPGALAGLWVLPDGGTVGEAIDHGEVPQLPRGR
jgi:hypothetical protein